MDQTVIDAARAAYPADRARVALGAVVHDGARHPQPAMTVLDRETRARAPRAERSTTIRVRGLPGALIGATRRRR